LSQVVFVGPQEKEAVVRYYAGCDIALVPLRKVDLFTDVLPSKIFEIMGMRRAMIVSVDGDARAEVERAGAGLFVEPENVDQLTSAIERLSVDAELRDRLGQNGRRHVESHYPRAVLARRYALILATVAQGKRGQASAVAARA
jgi:glycosyltransferase involved in cell wall biosynthesis